jgi:anti-sigma B factor antagonist
VASDEHLRIDVRREPGRVLLKLHGELDLLGAPLLESEIESAELDAPGRVVLDLEDLQFIDSAGLRVLLAAHERTRARGAELAVTQGSQQVQRLLTIAGVGEHLRIISSSGEMLV